MANKLVIWQQYIKSSTVYAPENEEKTQERVFKLPSSEKPLSVLFIKGAEPDDPWFYLVSFTSGLLTWGDLDGQRRSAEYQVKLSFFVDKLLEILDIGRGAEILHLS